MCFRVGWPDDEMLRWSGSPVRAMCLWTCGASVLWIHVPTLLLRAIESPTFMTTLRHGLSFNNDVEIWAAAVGTVAEVRLMGFILVELGYACASHTPIRYHPPRHTRVHVS